MPDFSHLLAKPSGDIKPPVSAPAGDYFGVITAHVFGESRNRKTPYVRYTIGNVEATPETASDHAERFSSPELDLGKKSPHVDFYLTEDAMFRLNEFLLSLDIDNGGGTRSVGEMIPEALNRPVQFSLTEELGQDGKTSYNNVAEVVGRV